jgi:hypothetical protein
MYKMRCFCFKGKMQAVSSLEDTREEQIISDKGEKKELVPSVNSCQVSGAWALEWNEAPIIGFRTR